MELEVEAVKPEAQASSLEPKIAKPTQEVEFTSVAAPFVTATQPCRTASGEKREAAQVGFICRLRSPVTGQRRRHYS